MLTDVTLKGELDGGDVVERIRVDFDYGKRRLPVLVMTGDSNPYNQSELLRAGANDLVQKPIEERLLVTKVLFQLRLARLDDQVVAVGTPCGARRTGADPAGAVLEGAGWGVAVAPGDARSCRPSWRQRKAAGAQIFPPGHDIFAAFEATPFDQVKVVILGQDPTTVSARRTDCASRYSRACRCRRRC